MSQQYSGVLKAANTLTKEHTGSLGESSPSIGHAGAGAAVVDLVDVGKRGLVHSLDRLLVAVIESND